MRRLVGSQKTREKAKSLLDKINKKKEEPQEEQKLYDKLPEPEPRAEPVEQKAEPETSSEQKEQKEQKKEPIKKRNPTEFIKCPSCGKYSRPNSMIFIMNVSNHKSKKEESMYKLVACPHKDCGVSFVVHKDYSIRGF